MTYNAPKAQEKSKVEARDEHFWNQEPIGTGKNWNRMLLFLEDRFQH